MWKNARIVRTDPKKGALVALVDEAGEGEGNKKGKKEATVESVEQGVRWNNVAFVSASHLGDGKEENIERKYIAGKKIDVRITGKYGISYCALLLCHTSGRDVAGFSNLDGVLQASARPSVVSATVLRYEDLFPGQLVKCTVLTAESFGVLVKLADGVKGAIKNSHLLDSGGDPEARKVSASVEFDSYASLAEPLVSFI